MSGTPAGKTPGKLSMWASQTSASARLAEAAVSKRLWRRSTTSMDDSVRTTRRVTTLALSSAGAYQVRGRLPCGSTAATNTTMVRPMAVEAAVRPREPMPSSRPATRPAGTVSSGGIDMPAIWMAVREREVKDLSQFVTSSDSRDPVLATHGVWQHPPPGPSPTRWEGLSRSDADLLPEKLQERRLVEDRDLEFLRFFQLRTGIGANDQVIRFLADVRADRTPERLDPLLRLRARHRVERSGENERLAREGTLLSLGALNRDAGIEQPPDQPARLRPLEILVHTFGDDRTDAANGS